MAWRLILVLLSMAAHFVWLYSDRSVQPQLQSGGAQNLPVAINLSMVSVAPVPDEQIKQKQPQQPQTKKEEVSQQPPRKETPKQQQPLPPKPKVAQEKRVTKPVTAIEPPAEKQSQEPESAKDLLEKTESEKAESEKVEPQVVAQAASEKRDTQSPGLDSLPVVKEVAFRSQPLPPVYPKLSLRKRQQGEALVQALVDSDGETQEIKLVRSSGYQALDQSALEAVRGWQFQAARVDGRPVTAWVEVPVAFQIN